MNTVSGWAAFAVMATSSAAFAEGLTFGGGVAITTNALSDGLSDTQNRPALQPWVEVGKGGFYAGLWATNLRDEAGNRAEVDLYGGYRGETAAGVTYDLGYTQFFYDKTHAASSEVSLAMGVPVGEKLTLAAEVSYDLAEKTFGESLGAEFTPADAWTLHADIGQADPEAGLNWGAGVTYDVTETTSLDLQVQKTESTNALAALTLRYAFGRTRE
jgi:uncharacterized protein (TIGR02001 family)